MLFRTKKGRSNFAATFTCYNTMVFVYRLLMIAFVI